MADYNIPRIVVGGTSSRSGKTTVSMGLMRALMESGLNVAPFKVGPDYIDPMFHKNVTGNWSRNLDSYMMGRSTLRRSLYDGSCGSSIAVVEGVMGLFDSHDSISEKGSTAEVAKILKAPVILVVDVGRTARTAAAIVKGFKGFDRSLNIRGVVLNRVGSSRHEKKLRESIEGLAGVSVVGAIPKDPSISLPERHLGLVTAHELEKDIKSLASKVGSHIDVEKIIQIAGTAEEIKIPEVSVKVNEASDKNVGILYDSAFRFYYIEAIEQITRKADLVFVDAIDDKRLPDLDVLYIGGGYPEVYAESLEKNASLRKDIFDMCASGKKVYAECGGLMYLGEEIATEEGVFEMVGFLPLSTEMQNRYVGMGYVVNKVVKDNPLSRRGETIVGHEFHHSRITLKGKVRFVYKTQRGTGIDGGHDGILKEKVLASYMHIHPLGYKDMVGNLLA